MKKKTKKLQLNNNEKTETIDNHFIFYKNILSLYKTENE